MSLKERCGRIIYYLVRPTIHVLLRGSRRAYVVIEQDGKILVVKNFLGSGKWHLPGGGCHKDESYASAAVREVNEEVGLVIEQSALQALGAPEIFAKRGFRYSLFLHSLQEPVTLRLDQIEIIDACWVHPDELTPVNAGETTLRALDVRTL